MGWNTYFPSLKTYQSLIIFMMNYAALKMSRPKADAIKGIADFLVYENISFKEIIDNRDVMVKC